MQHGCYELTQGPAVLLHDVEHLRGYAVVERHLRQAGKVGAFVLVELHPDRGLPAEHGHFDDRFPTALGLHPVLQPGDLRL